LPRYDYVCDDCSHRFELRQSFDSETVADCSNCGGNSKRQFHAPPVIYKGSGWYVNDYGKGRGANGTGSDKEGAEKSETSAKSESKDSGSSASTERSASKSESTPESKTAPTKSE
jgi:putative FmdB family regulatory protein